MNRRRFLAITGAAAAIPAAAQAEGNAVRVVGFLRSTPAAPFAHLVTAFRGGLKEQGFVEGTNLRIEYRFADNHLERLPVLASELIGRHVDVIVGNSQAAEAAKAATKSIPIVFVTADDPIRRGLVGNLSRPGGNVTGLSFFGGGALEAKRMELLNELVPSAAIIAVLQDPNWPGTAIQMPDIEKTARQLGKTLVVVKAASEGDLAQAFETIRSSGAHALLVGGSPMFSSNRRTLVALAARYRLPAIYDLRDHVEAGGLISYAGSLGGAYHQAGDYAGRILKGAKPAELPVLQPTLFELAINLKTAKALGIDVSPSILVRADVVIE